MNPPVTPSYYFALRCAPDAPEVDAVFEEVHGIEADEAAPAGAETEPSGFVHRLPASARPLRLRLLRGQSKKASALMRWVQAVLGGGIALPVEVRDVTLMLYDPAGLPVRTWLLTGAWPLRWSADDLSSGADLVRLASIELGYAGCTRT